VQHLQALVGHDARRSQAWNPLDIPVACDGKRNPEVGEGVHVPGQPFGVASRIVARGKEREQRFLLMMPAACQLSPTRKSMQVVLGPQVKERLARPPGLADEPQSQSIW
jgi:hypothetical protein